MNKRTDSSERRHSGIEKQWRPSRRREDTGEKAPEAIQPFKLRGRRIEVDSQGRISLNDIHKAGRFSVNQTPSQWGRLENTQRLAVKVLEKTMGKSHSFSKSDILSVYCTKVGRNGGVWVHPNLALAYAKYLSADLHYEVNEVFLRAKSGDATLADEILEKASPEANAWAGVRAMGRAERGGFTATLKEHGVTGWGYGTCTNEIYIGLFDKRAKDLKAAKGIVGSGALRDKFNIAELSYTAATEHLAAERIAEEKRHGNEDCRKASALSAGFMRRAIDADRASRRKAPV